MSLNSKLFELEYEKFSEVAFELMDLTNTEFNNNMDESVEEAVSKAEQTIHDKLLEINAYNIGEDISSDDAMSEICNTIRLHEKLIELYTHCASIVGLVEHLSEFNELATEMMLELEFHNQNLIYLYNTMYELCSDSVSEFNY